ncbi:hypothetical protein SESBI_45069 [Sesbania bispinosa]|nr:hypothetical protein SESBI_45069 [Sesbania bispinosa]
MGDELVGVVFEVEEVVSVLVDGGGELVLDAFPGSEVSGFFVVVLPGIASRLEDDAWSGKEDLSGGGEAALEEGLERFQEERRKFGQWWEGMDHLPLFCSNSLEVKWELRMDDEEDEGEWMHKHVDDG